MKRFKQLLLDYNGSALGKVDYENIEAVMMDAGAGGQATGGISDQMLDDWEMYGETHRGIIDTHHKANETAVATYPNALDIVHLVDPKGNRNDLFDAIEKMVKMGLVSFPAEYDGKDYLTFIDESGNETRYDLTSEEQIALAQIELLKTEIITMCKYTNLDSVKYDFPPDKRNKMHDDRVYAFGLLCWWLAKMRRGQIINKPRESVDMNSIPFTVSQVDFEG